MSDAMLFGVLRMPLRMVLGNDIAVAQLVSRAHQAADLIEQLQKELAETKLMLASEQIDAARWKKRALEDERDGSPVSDAQRPLFDQP